MLKAGSRAFLSQLLPTDPNFWFWIGPCTLTSKNIAELTVEMDTPPLHTFDYEILDLFHLEEF